MLTKTIGYEKYYKVKGYVSFSSLAAFHRCPRRFFYQACGLCVPEHPAMTFGTGIHSGIPFVWRGNMENAINAFLEKWGDTEDTEKRNKVTAIELFDKFAKSHPKGGGFYKIVPPPEGEEASEKRSDDEVSLLIDIGAGKLVFMRIDAIGEMYHDEGKYTIEYKTTSEMGSLFIGCFLNHPQLLVYHLGLRMVLGDIAKGSIVEGFRTGKKTEVMTLPPLIPDEHVMNQFIEEMTETVERILLYEENQTFPQCRYGCTSHPCYAKAYFYCEYQHLCSVEDWTSLQDMYEVRHYEPLAERREGELYDDKV